jgi:hypothetical protein
VRGVNVSGPDGEHERRVRFIGFEPGDENEFVAVDQVRVDPPGAVGVRGFFVPDVVFFVNGPPLVVSEAKSPAVTDPSPPLSTRCAATPTAACRKERGGGAAVLDEPPARRHRLLRRPRRLGHRPAGRLPAVALGHVELHPPDPERAWRRAPSIG